MKIQFENFGWSAIPFFKVFQGNFPHAITGRSNDFILLYHHLAPNQLPSFVGSVNGVLQMKKALHFLIFFSKKTAPPQRDGAVAKGIPPKPIQNPELLGRRMA